MQKLPLSFLHFRKNGAVRFIAFAAFLIACFSSCKNSEKPTGSGPVYTPMQQVFCLNMLSNVSGEFNGSDSNTIVSKTQAAIDSVLNDGGVQGLIGTWTRVWGPMILTYHDTALNTMFIARQTGTDNYVVAIAGTDPTSKPDWILEDFDIVGMVPWRSNNDVDSSKKITLPTFTGLQALIWKPYMVDTKIPVTSVEFLTAAALLKPINVWVTGHSLGGALSPTFALFLNDTKNIWARKGATINCLAAAGATPGNDSFSAYYDRMLGNNTFRVWNQRDVVPHGFQPNMIEEILPLYAGDTLVDSLHIVIDSVYIDPHPIIRKLDSVATKFRLWQLYPADTINFVSNYYQPPADTTRYSISYLIEALYQHVPAYAAFFGVDSFQRAAQRVLTLKSPFFSAGLPPTNIVNYDTTGKGFNNTSFDNMFQ